MQIVATQIRVGQILNLENELYRVTWTMHRTPGKGNAVMQTKLKHIITGKNQEKRFMSNERVEKAMLETQEMQYLYKEGEHFIFMNNESFEQVPISVDLMDEGSEYLAEGVTYPVTFFNAQPVGIELPQTLDFKVTMAPPEIKKATATSSMRPVELENGMTIQAPGFIKEGDIVRINTADSSYVERVKK